MQFGILGPLEVARDGQPLSITAPMQRAVLAALLLDAGRVLSTDRLVERLWGALPPKTARVTLQTYVLRLRRALGPQVIRTRAPGYLVDVPPQDLDLHRFDALVDRARALRSENSAAPAAAVLDEALRLWRGQALADVGSDHLRRTEGVQLEERRLRAVEERTDIGLELGEHAVLVDRLRRLVAEHPLRERLHGQLMLALYRAGQPGEALLAYRDARRALVTELGIEPGRELQELQAAVLDRDPALDLAAPQRRPPGWSAAPRAHRIARPIARAAPRSPGAVATVPRPVPAPAAEPDHPGGPEQLTRFVGRVREAGEVLRLIGGIRLLTITGPAGCGKSRLVEHVLHQPGFGAYHLVQLAGLADPARLSGAVATELGLRPDGDLVEQLRGRAAVVVLDNCEHLVDACAGLAVRLLTGCPGIRLLVTSREPLAVPGEHRMRLAPLPTPRAGPRSAVGAHPDDATALFLDRAAAARPGFAVTSHLAPYVEDIVRRLDGMPLAIELAAARLDALPIEEVAAQLDDQLGLLTGGSRTGRPDHRTLRRAVEWSYALLEPDERRLFRELSVFAGGFTAAAAAGVCTRPGRDTDVFELLADLAVKSMVMVEPGARAVRYRLLEPLRQFARHRLDSCGGLAERRRRHAAHFRLWAPAADAEAVAAEEDNLREAMSWFMARGHLGAATELAAVLDRSRPYTGASPPADRAATHRELAVPGSFAAGRGRYAAAASLYRRALRPARAGGGLHAAAEYLILLAELEAVTGRPEAAYPLLDRAARLYLTLDDATGLATATLQRGELEAAHGDHTVARALLADAGERLRLLDVPAGTARAQLALGRLALADGSPGAATAPLIAALVTFHRVGDRDRLATTLEHLATASRDPVRAATLLGAAELLRQAAEAVPAPVDQVGLAGTVDRVRRELDPADFELAWERGRSRTVAETVRFACLPEAAAEHYG
jgi:predicted ATPase/DNA-binding SARP family transcriptional activator